MNPSKNLDILRLIILRFSPILLVSLILQVIRKTAYLLVRKIVVEIAYFHIGE